MKKDVENLDIDTKPDQICDQIGITDYSISWPLKTIWIETNDIVKVEDFINRQIVDPFNIILNERVLIIRRP